VRQSLRESGIIASTAGGGDGGVLERLKLTPNKKVSPFLFLINFCY
jgi:hypothetical protein